MTIRVENVTRRFNDFTAVNDLSLDIADGELLALLGPSGSGKTTLLRLIAGLDFPDAGRILFDGVDATPLSAAQRRIGFVFQQYALFRHMTVRQNIDFGLRVMPTPRRPAAAERAARVQTLIDKVQLTGLANRFPAQLSGGQRQRVALARALAIGPRVLLLDEPFGALDAAVRKDLRRWLRQLHDEIQVTTIFVTHDQDEALEIADRVVVMNAGRIEQIGTPRQVEEHPATPFMHGFLGNSNRFEVDVAQGVVLLSGRPLTNLTLEIAPDVQGRAQGYVRPHDLSLLPPEDPRAATRARLTHWQGRGGLLRAELDDPATGQTFEAELPRADWDAHPFDIGAPVGLRPRRMQIFAI